MHKPSIRLTTAICAAALAIGTISQVQATTYYWLPGDIQGVWDAQDNGVYINWSTEGLEGAAATALPSDADDLYGSSSVNIDLGNEVRTFKYCNTDGNYDTAFSMTIENGTLQFTREVRRFRGSIDINNGATLLMSSGSTLYTGVYQGSTEARRFPININAGGNMVVSGTARFYNTKYFVNDGGELTFQPSTLRISCEGNACNDGIENNGIMNLPNGLTLNTFDSTSATAGASFTIWQNAGTMNLGGPITIGSQAGTFNVDFAGGTVNVTDDASFNVSLAEVTGAITFNVASGKTLDVSSLQLGSGGSMIKAGAGYIAFPATAQPVTVSAGGVALHSGTYDLSNVTFGSGTTIHLSTLGGTVNAYSPSLTANATFTADLTGVPAGTTVFNSSDATLLAKAQTDLASAVPQGLGLEISGTQLTLETQTSSGNSFSMTGDILQGTGWGGTVPAAGENVAIDGNGVVASLTSGSLPAWDSIEVKNGATLRIATDAATLPPITLNKNATLEIVNNATVTLSGSANLAGVVNVANGVVTIPGVSIESGSTLRVPGGMKFSNVNISLAGTLNVITEGGVTFGYAESGETTYIGFSANGGTVSLVATSSNYDASSLEFCCPASGGSVVAVGNLSFVNASILPVYVSSSVTYTFTESYKYGFHLGDKNPTNELFELVFDNTSWGVCGKTIIKGGATFRLINGATYKEYETHTLWNRTAEISEMGRVVVGSGCEFRLPAMGDYGNKPLEIKPGYAGHKSIVVEDGGVFETYRSSGNGKGILAISNGVYQVYLPWTTNAAFEVVAHNIPFEGLSAVEIADNSSLSFSTRNRVFWNPGQFHNESGDRVVALADVPITGGGSIVVSNANANVFGVIVQSGANTATGTASVTVPAEGLGATTLYFADGANWAGTVVADGNVVLTNLTDGASSTSVTFGSLDLTENFPIRVWNNAGTLANDKINVDAYVANGGKLTPVLVNGDVWPSGTSFEVGKIAKGAELPPLAKNWVASVKSIDNDDDYDMLCLRYFKGTQIILR